MRTSILKCIKNMQNNVIRSNGQMRENKQIIIKYLIQSCQKHSEYVV
ncbi:hypothetical protein LINPERHAP2_LOCUS28973 [Linum perenne]